MRILTAVLLSLAAIPAVSGCGGQDDSTPVACLEGEGVYFAALGAAPGAVRLDGEVPISNCLTENQQAGDLATVGTTMVLVATELNADARSDPGGAASLQLGYLLGAAQRGAAETSGIHSDLIRRLAAAARYSPDNRPLPAAFLRIYREGFDAGRAGG
jgi:hypothetical protein